MIYLGECHSGGPVASAEGNGMTLALGGGADTVKVRSKIGTAWTILLIIASSVGAAPTVLPTRKWSTHHPS